MKKIIFLFCLIINGLSAQKLTLSEAIKTGLENNIALKTQGLQVQLTTSENEKLKAKWLPQVTAAADARVNTQLQTSILPFDITGKNPGKSSQVRFGLPYSNTLGFQADQKIFDANKKIDKQLNNMQGDVQSNLLEQQKSSVRQNITEAYYAAIYNKERIALAEKTIIRAEQNLENAGVKLKNGTLLQNDFDRYQLDVKNASITLKKAKLDLSNSLENLKYQMNVKTEAELDVAEDLASILKINDLLPTQNINQRAEIKGEELALKLNGMNQDKQKFRNYPTVSAYGNYTVLQQINTPNIFQSGSLFPFNYVGIRVSMPVFDGKQSKIIANEFALKQEINRLNIERLRNDFSFDSQNALRQTEQAKLAMTETKQNIELAQQILKTDLFRYEKGILGFAEVKNSEASLQNAETNYLANVYSLLVATIAYKRAVGGF